MTLSEPEAADLKAGKLYLAVVNKKRIRVSARADLALRVVTYAEPERAAPGGEMSRLWQNLPGVRGSDYNVFFHSDHESADTVPWTGLAAITLAYAKIIDGVNTLDLKDLQRAPEVS